MTPSGLDSDCSSESDRLVLCIGCLISAGDAAITVHWHVAGVVSGPCSQRLQS